jgi:hypothetical protein
MPTSLPGSPPEPQDGPRTPLLLWFLLGAMLALVGALIIGTLAS